MAFLGIKIPDELANLLSDIDVPGNKELKDNLHITFLMLSSEPIDIKDVSEIIKVTYNIFSKIEPFFVSFDKLTNFPKGDKGYPIILTISSKKFEQIHKKLWTACEEAGIDFSKKFKNFRPHITLSYSDKPIKETNISELGFTVTEFVLWGGSKDKKLVDVTFPLELKSLAHNNLFNIIKMAEKFNFILHKKQLN